MPENNNRPVRIYTKEFKRTLETVFGVEAAFARASQNVQVLDGVRNNATAFSVKTNNTPVVIGTYNTDPNVAMGSGTTNSNRFGDRTEIIYNDIDVPYDYTISIHEGIDHMTVNEELDFVVAERQLLQAQAVVRQANVRAGRLLSASAGAGSESVALTEEAVLAAFARVAAMYKNLEVTVPITSYITADVYNILVDSGKITSGKGSSVNIDTNTLNMHRDFRLVVTPEKYYAEGDIAYFCPDGIVLPFVGFDMYRAIESEGFSGVALQSAGKGGAYVATDNKQAIYKFTQASAQASAQIKTK